MAVPSKNTLLLSGIIVPVVAAVLTALLTDVGKEISNQLFPTKVFFEGYVLEAGDPVTNLTVYLNQQEQSDITDNRGRFIFADVSEGCHTCNFEYKGKAYRYRIVIDGSVDETVSDQFDIGAKAVETPELQPEESIESRPPAETAPETPIPSETESGTGIAASLRVPTNTSQQVLSARSLTVQNLLLDELSANQLLEQLSLHVRVNKMDKNRSGKQFAFNYYLAGDEKLLDKVKAVYYIRNHKSFSEYENDRYLSAFDRSSNFNYKGYQWGYIKTVNVKLLLNNDKESDWELKEIVYD